MYLYVHIPFCKSKCAYCDFFSIPIGHNSSCKIKNSQNNADSSLIPDVYIDAVLAEAAFNKKCHSIEQWHTIYIGGGTPGLLSSIQLERLLRGLINLCTCVQDTEISLEVNSADIAYSVQNDCKNDVDNNYLEKVAQVGVNRISCGIQSLDDASLNAVGRRSSALEARKALVVLQKWRDFACATSADAHSRLRQFSVDIIAGLPELTEKNFVAGVEEVLSYKPDHISLYSLIIEDGTPLCKAIDDGILPFDADNADSQWLVGCDMLKKAGYSQYEVSNFASKNLSYSCEGRHNSAYWRMDDYIGLGAGACGTVGAERFTGSSDIDAYCAYWTSADTNLTLEPPSHICSVEHISLDERITEFLMMGFRTLQGVDSDEFFRRFKFPIEQKIGSVFERWQERNLACCTDNFYALTADGLLFLNQFLKEIV